MLNQSSGGISLLKKVKMDMPYQRWYHPASPFTQEGRGTIDQFIKMFERPEMAKLFAKLFGKVRTLSISSTFLFANLKPNKNHDFLLSVQHLFLYELNIGSNAIYWWKHFIQHWLINATGIKDNPRFFL